MATEVANQQIAANATEENTAETKAEETAVVKDEQKSDEATKNNAENHSEAPAAAPAKVVAPKITVHKADFEKDIIYLYQFSRTPFLPSLSPYCLKVETWLRLAGLKYEVSFFESFSQKKIYIQKIEISFHTCYNTIFTLTINLLYFLNY